MGANNMYDTPFTNSTDDQHFSQHITIAMSRSLPSSSGSPADRLSTSRLYVSLPWERVVTHGQLTRFNLRRLGLARAPDPSAPTYKLNKFAEYKKQLPLQDIEEFCKAFPMVDQHNLKTELGIFYSRPEIIGNDNLSGCWNILKFLISFGLDSTAFKEVAKVLKILVTMPMTTSETERCFSTLKLIKTFLRNRMGEERSTALAMLSIEKQLVKNIPDFNKKVIARFCANKNRRMEFHFK
ncbi:hypothetical protein ILUMI_23864 [Ignelater luminosus]|uniref:HAT C-terminal dimerisation domain-containing protein n=1 Tax=Ignelater luminosus TaxID=2038154 RepID=A0A8K0G1H8_IGNLU|nr:hypothetical protein ILUMI_23864 [Ignelater luminosus]